MMFAGCIILGEKFIGLTPQVRKKFTGTPAKLKNLN
jgi:hypothetical protein